MHGTEPSALQLARAAWQPLTPSYPPRACPKHLPGEDAKATKGLSFAQGYARPRTGAGTSSQRGGEADADVQLLLWQLLHRVLLNYVPPPLEGAALAGALAGARRATRRATQQGPQQEQQQQPELELEPMRRPEHEASYAMLHARVVPNSRVIQFLGQQMFGQGHFWCGSAGLHDLSTSSVMLFGSIGGNSGFHLDPSAAENTAWPIELRFDDGDASLAARATRGAHAAYARQVRGRGAGGRGWGCCCCRCRCRCSAGEPPGPWGLRRRPALSRPFHHPVRPRPSPAPCRRAGRTRLSPSPGPRTSGWWTWRGLPSWAATPAPSRSGPSCTPRRPRWPRPG